MKYVKLLGLLAVAASGLMAFTGTASATTLTSPSGTTYTSTITAVNEGHVVLHGSFTSITCEYSHFAGKIEQHSPGVTAGGKLSTLAFAGCGDYPVTVKKAGSLEFHGISPTGNGTVTSSGAEIEVHTSVGSCVFTTNSTHLGTLTGSNNVSPPGSNATLDIVAAKLPRTGGSFLCGSSGTWTAFYQIRTPSTLEVH